MNWMEEISFFFVEWFIFDKSKQTKQLALEHLIICL